MTPTHVAEAFAIQSTACITLDSPFMGQLMGLFATRDWPDGAITQRVFDWQGDLRPRAQSVPLRMAGALHALHLQGHDQLSPVYPPAVTTDDALWDAVCAALITDAAFIDAWIDSAPQTNEVRRSAALIPMGHVVADRFDLPIRTSELGASGGLNLHWDAYALRIGDAVFGPDNAALTLTPEWSGALPPLTRPEVISRAAVDLNPLDPARDTLRLQAYLWPDQPDRMALTRAAMAATTTKVDKGDAIDWLAGRMGHQAGQTHLIYTTIAWQYFPDAAQARGKAMIEAAGAAATDNSPLAWFGMEYDGGRGAALTLRVWPGDVTLTLGRADFHGRWIDWAGAA